MDWSVSSPVPVPGGLFPNVPNMFTGTNTTRGRHRKSASIPMPSTTRVFDSDAEEPILVEEDDTEDTFPQEVVVIPEPETPDIPATVEELIGNGQSVIPENVRSPEAVGTQKWVFAPGQYVVRQDSTEEVSLQGVVSAGQSSFLPIPEEPVHQSIEVIADNHRPNSEINPVQGLEKRLGPVIIPEVNAIKIEDDEDEDSDVEMTGTSQTIFDQPMPSVSWTDTTQLMNTFGQSGDMLNMVPSMGSMAVAESSLDSGGNTLESVRENFFREMMISGKKLAMESLTDERGAVGVDEKSIPGIPAGVIPSGYFVGWQPGMKCPVPQCTQNIMKDQRSLSRHWLETHTPRYRYLVCELCFGCTQIWNLSRQGYIKRYSDMLKHMKKMHFANIHNGFCKEIFQSVHYEILPNRNYIEPRFPGNLTNKPKPAKEVHEIPERENVSSNRSTGNGNSKNRSKEVSDEAIDLQNYSSRELLDTPTRMRVYRDNKNDPNVAIGIDPPLLKGETSLKDADIIPDEFLKHINPRGTVKMCPSESCTFGGPPHNLYRHWMEMHCPVSLKIICNLCMGYNFKTKRYQLFAGHVRYSHPTWADELVISKENFLLNEKVCDLQPFRNSSFQFPSLPSSPAAPSDGKSTAKRPVPGSKQGEHEPPKIAQTKTPNIGSNKVIDLPRGKPETPVTHAAQGKTRGAGSNIQQVPNCPKTIEAYSSQELRDVKKRRKIVKETMNDPTGAVGMDVALLKIDNKPLTNADVYPAMFLSHVPQKNSFKCPSVTCNTEGQPCHMRNHWMEMHCPVSLFLMCRHCVRSGSLSAFYTKKTNNLMRHVITTHNMPGQSAFSEKHVDDFILLPNPTFRKPEIKKSTKEQKLPSTISSPSGAKTVASTNIPVRRKRGLPACDEVPSKKKKNDTNKLNGSSPVNSVDTNKDLTNGLNSLASPELLRKLEKLRSRRVADARSRFRICKEGVSDPGGAVGMDIKVFGAGLCLENEELFPKQFLEYLGKGCPSAGCTHKCRNNPSTHRHWMEIHCPVLLHLKCLLCLKDGAMEFSTLYVSDFVKHLDKKHPNWREQLTCMQSDIGYPEELVNYDFVPNLSYEKPYVPGEENVENSKKQNVPGLDDTKSRLELVKSTAGKSEEAIGIDVDLLKTGKPLQVGDFLPPKFIKHLKGSGCPSANCKFKGIAANFPSHWMSVHCPVVLIMTCVLCQKKGQTPPFCSNSYKSLVLHLNDVHSSWDKATHGKKPSPEDFVSYCISTNNAYRKPCLPTAQNNSSAVVGKDKMKTPRVCSTRLQIRTDRKLLSAKDLPTCRVNLEPLNLKSNYIEAKKLPVGKHFLGKVGKGLQVSQCRVRIKPLDLNLMHGMYKEGKVPKKEQNFQVGGVSTSRATRSGTKYSVAPNVNRQKAASVHTISTAAKIKERLGVGLKHVPVVRLLRNVPSSLTIPQADLKEPSIAKSGSVSFKVKSENVNKGDSGSTGMKSSVSSTEGEINQVSNMECTNAKCLAKRRMHSARMACLSKELGSLRYELSRVKNRAKVAQEERNKAMTERDKALKLCESLTKTTNKLKNALSQSSNSHKVGENGESEFKRGRGRPSKSGPVFQSSKTIKDSAHQNYEEDSSSNDDTALNMDSGDTSETNNAIEKRDGGESVDEVVKRGRGRPRKRDSLKSFKQNEEDSSCKNDTDVESDKQISTEHTSVENADSRDSVESHGSKTKGESKDKIVKRGRGRPRKHSSTFQNSKTNIDDEMGHNSIEDDTTKLDAEKETEEVANKESEGDEDSCNREVAPDNALLDGDSCTKVSKVDENSLDKEELQESTVEEGDTSRKEVTAIEDEKIGKVAGKVQDSKEDHHGEDHDQENMSTEGAVMQSVVQDAIEKGNSSHSDGDPIEAQDSGLDSTQDSGFDSSKNNRPALVDGETVTEGSIAFLRSDKCQMEGQEAEEVSTENKNVAKDQTKSQDVKTSEDGCMSSSDPVSYVEECDLGLTQNNIAEIDQDVSLGRDASDVPGNDAALECPVSDEALDQNETVCDNETKPQDSVMAEDRDVSSGKSDPEAADSEGHVKENNDKNSEIDHRNENLGKMDTEEDINSQNESLGEKDTEEDIEIQSEGLGEKDTEEDIDIQNESLGEKDTGEDIEIQSEGLGEKDTDEDIDIQNESLGEKDTEEDIDIQNESLGEKDTEEDIEIQSEGLGEKETEENIEIRNESLGEKETETEEDIEIQSEGLGEKETKENIDIQNESLGEQETEENIEIQNESLGEKETEENINMQNESLGEQETEEDIKIQNESLGEKETEKNIDMQNESLGEKETEENINMQNESFGEKETEETINMQNESLGEKETGENIDKQNESLGEKETEENIKIQNESSREETEENINIQNESLGEKETEENIEIQNESSREKETETGEDIDMQNEGSREKETEEDIDMQNESLGEKETETGEDIEMQNESLGEKETEEDIDMQNESLGEEAEEDIDMQNESLGEKETEEDIDMQNESSREKVTEENIDMQKESLGEETEGNLEIQSESFREKETEEDIDSENERSAEKDTEKDLNLMQDEENSFVSDVNEQRGINNENEETSVHGEYDQSISISETLPKHGETPEANLPNTSGAQTLSQDSGIEIGLGQAVECEISSSQDYTSQASDIWKSQASSLPEEEPCKADMSSDSMLHPGVLGSDTNESPILESQVTDSQTDSAKMVSDGRDYASSSEPSTAACITSNQKYSSTPGPRDSEMATDNNAFDNNLGRASKHPAMCPPSYERTEYGDFHNEPEEYPRRSCIVSGGGRPDNYAYPAERHRSAFTPARDGVMMPGPRFGYDPRPFIPPYPSYPSREGPYYPLPRVPHQGYPRPYGGQPYHSESPRTFFGYPKPNNGRPRLPDPRGPHPGSPNLPGRMPFPEQSGRSGNEPSYTASQAIADSLEMINWNK